MTLNGLGRYPASLPVMHLFFYPDGTLTDSSPGITRCINHALKELGHSPATDEQLRGMIGDPLTAIFCGRHRREPSFPRRG